MRRGVPRMSPARLTKRLQMLVRAGIVARREDGGLISYELTPSSLAATPRPVGVA